MAEWWEYPVAMGTFGLSELTGTTDVLPDLSTLFEREAELLQTPEEAAREELRLELLEEMRDVAGEPGVGAERIEDLITGIRGQMGQDYIPPGAYRLPDYQELAPYETAPVQYRGAEPLEGAALEEYYQRAIADPMIEQYKEEILPGIRARVPSLHTGYAARLEQKAAENLARGLTRERAGLEWQNLLRGQELATTAGQQQMAADLAAQRLMAQAYQAQAGRGTDIWRTRAGLGMQAYEDAARRAQAQAQFGQEFGLTQAKQLYNMIMGTDPQMQAQQAMYEFATGQPTPTQWMQQPTPVEQFGAGMEVLGQAQQAFGS